VGIFGRSPDCRFEIHWWDDLDFFLKSSKFNFGKNRRVQTDNRNKVVGDLISRWTSPQGEFILNGSDLQAQAKLRVTLPRLLPHTNTLFPFMKYTIYPISISELIMLTKNIVE
jgi:hypothetical protein